MRDRIILHLYECNNYFLGLYYEKVGITKEIDDLGRLHIPKEIRNRLGLGGTVQLVVTEDGLLIKSEEYKLTKIYEIKEKTEK